jgi:putative PEP-CTERM system histidine kinase
VASYGLAAAGFLFLTALLLTSWEGRAQGGRLIVACLVTTAWATLQAFGPDFQPSSAHLAQLSEFLRYGAWFFVLTGLVRTAGAYTLLSRAVHGAWIAGAFALAAAPFLAGVSLIPDSSALVLASAGILMALLGLLMLGWIYRNSTEKDRDPLRFLLVALGLIFAYDLILFAQALLQKSMPTFTWQARGLVTLLTVPLIAIAARRNPQWSLNLFVSRHVVFHSVRLLIIFLSFLLVAVAAHWVRQHGGAWGPAAQWVFVSVAALALLAAMASENLQRRLRVFLNQHFYRNKYDYRLEWLRFIQMLSVPLEGADARANAVRAMGQIINSPGGVLYLRSEDGEAFRPAASWPQAELESGRHPVLPPQDELVAFLRERQWVIDLAELRTSPDVYGSLSLPDALRGTKDLGAGCDRLIVPLTHLDTLIGFVVLVDPPESFEPNYEDRDLLKMMGRHVAVHLAQSEADRRLAESRQFEAYHRLTAFVMHDLRNLAAQLALIVSNAERHRRNPQFVDDAIGTIAISTERMQRLIEQLQRREVQGAARRISLAGVARKACARCSSRKPRPVCSGLVEDAWVEADPERLTMIVEHVIRNAQDATPENGSVSLSVSLDGTDSAKETSAPIGATNQLRIPTVALTVADTGVGMSAEFIAERLFKPFDSTKGSKGMGIGAYQVREYVRSLGGRVDVASLPGQGTRVTLRIPLAGLIDADGA